MKKTYAMRRLLEHGPMTMDEIVDCTRWPRYVCRWVLTYLVDRIGEVDREDGVYSLSSNK
jgi:hypothetical protein